jgi:GNAT superfamily N-acetyltransferase
MLTISDLREKPGFFDVVADRIWRAFWHHNGYPVQRVTDPLRDSLDPAPLPATLVAHAGGLFLGTASVVLCDEASRPQYSPWIAAVWVEPDHRKSGIAAALVEQAAQTAFMLGAGRLHLAASKFRRAFYEKRGWTMCEENVPGYGMHILTRVP